MKIGVLNGGGDAPGLNSVIRAVAKTAIIKYGYEVVGFRDGFKGLIEDAWQLLSLQTVSGILPKGGTILGTTNRDNPFDYQGRDASPEIRDNFQRHGLEGLVVVGGDGTLSIAHELFRRWHLAVVGVPKTIDNDLMATDTTFGFHTAVQTATHACDMLHDTAESHHRVMILEVMGRYAGWIALYAGLSGGADIILLPEIPYSMEAIFRKIREREDAGKRFSIMVVAEGVRTPAGEYAIRSTVATGKEKMRLGGIGNVLAGEIESITGVESRATVLGHLQRGGSPNAYDRLLGTRLGVKAVELVAAGDFGKMVAIRGEQVVAVDLSLAVKQNRLVPAGHELLEVARALGICLGEE